MTAALKVALEARKEREVTLIGYSGGGVLAMLIAPRVERVTRVVTVAANLDIDAWARHHGYSRLGGSLNPATASPLPPTTRQVHLAGGRDARVPPHLSRPVAERQPSARFLVIPDFDHRCCWEREWPAVLAALDEIETGQELPDRWSRRLTTSESH
jgi:pimeloyl-ACP methyl ester carboxylesterase